jgi:hypothetical protein
MSLLDRSNYRQEFFDDVSIASQLFQTMRRCGTPARTLEDCEKWLSELSRRDRKALLGAFRARAAQQPQQPESTPWDVVTGQNQPLTGARIITQRPPLKPMMGPGGYLFDASDREIEDAREAQREATRRAKREAEAAQRAIDVANAQANEAAVERAFESELPQHVRLHQ